MNGLTRAGPVIAAAAVLAACEPPPLKIVFQVSGGPVQACPAAAMSAPPTCADVPMLCDAVLNIRIVRPSLPQETYLPLCEEVPLHRERDLCSIASIDLPSSQLPKDTLEVQVMIWPRDAVKQDPITGELDCREIHGQPVLVGFGLHGFPEEVTPSPALGGRAYYHPGDAQTVVTLGCSDLAAVNRPTCSGASGLEVRAAVNEFERPIRSVPASMVGDLAVSVGEPRFTGGEHRLESTSALDPVSPGPGQAPAWLASIEDPDLVESMCVQVIGTSGSNTATVRCDELPPAARRLDVTGFWMPSELLDEIVTGMGLAGLPPEGLTLGVVLDPQGRPADGYQVLASPGAAVAYLGANRQVIPGGTATASSGLFVSQDAPYGTSFTASSGALSLTATGLGGRVSGRVTIVVLQLAPAAD